METCGRCKLYPEQHRGKEASRPARPLPGGAYEGTSSTGRVKQALGLTSDITGRRVIVVEDIVDTGNTIVELKNILAEKGAAESKICTLLLKPDAYKKDEPIDYVAMEIPNDFIVGFGLDYDEIGRNLKDIYILDE